MSEFSQFETLLKQTMGLNAKSVGSAMIARAVTKRCAASGVADIAAYWRLVNESPAALQELVELVIVPETWFFRDSEAFKALARLASSHTLSSGRRLRILSMPCSTGEEPYSIAMALLDAGVSPTAFYIDALDLCTASVATAQQAVYSANSFRGKDLEFRNRYFVPIGDRYALAETIRSKVRFRQGNLFDPTLLAGEGGYDFIFCRNVLIYFGDAEQARVITVLGRLLNNSGTLFVGPSEGGVLFRENMVSANMPLAFAFRKAPKAGAHATPRAVGSPRPAAVPVRPVPVPVPHPARPVRPSARAQTLPTPRQRDVVPADNDPIAVATRLADQGQLRQAAELCKRHLQDHKPTAAAFYLLGLVSDAAGHHLEARENYRRALYLDPDHAQALVHLAALLEMQGDTAGAKRMNDRARRATTQHIDRHG